MKYRFFFLFTISVFCNSQIISQSTSNVQLIKETEGIPIGPIISDKNGQIWISTYTNGLMKYNGNEIIKFENNPYDSNSIQGNEIAAIYEDNMKNIWISIGSNGSFELIRYNPVSKKIKKYGFHNIVGKERTEKYVQIVDIKYIQNKLLFTIAFNAPLEKSILYFDPASDKLKVFAPNSKHPDYSYAFIQKPGASSVVVLGHDNQLYELSVQQDTIYKMPFSELQALANNAAPGVPITYDANGKLWILSNNAILYCFDNIHSSPVKTYSFKHLSPSTSNNLTSAKYVAVDKNQNIWISTSDGLFFLNKSQEKFTKIEMPVTTNGKAYKIYSLIFDSFNNLWIGTETGLLKYENKPIFTNYIGKSIDTNLQVSGYVGDIKQRKDGSIGFSSGEFIDGEHKVYLNSLNLQNNTLKHAYLTQLFPKGVVFTGIQEIGIDTFFIGTERGTYLLSNNLKSLAPLKLPGVPNIHPGFTMLFKDRFQNEWLGSLSYLYSKMKGVETFKAIDLSTQPGGSEESNMMILEDGKHHGLWILTLNGLFLYHYTTKQITRHGYDPKNKGGFLAQSIQSIYTEDSSDIVWVAIRNGGLNKYDVKTNKLKTFTTTHGLPHLTVNTIQPDLKNSILWLGTDNGISKFDITDEKFTNYSTADGIRGKFFSTSLKASNGQLFFGGDGLIRFTPDEIKSESLPPLVSILDIKAGNKSMLESYDSISSNTSITLNHQQNNIRIEYLVVHYTDPKNNKYAYKLDGFESEWNQVQNQNTAYYTNLSAGEYTFRIKAANSNGLWSEADATIRLKILPPWWKTNIAYLFYLLAIGIVAKLGNTYYKHRVLEQERSKSQAKELEQAKEIEKAYKELEVSHTALKNTQAQLIQSEKMASLGELTAGIAHEIQNPLNFVNNFSELNSELVKELEEESSSETRDADNEKLLLKAIRENSEKINHHGKRAESIVKGMLEHSRKSTGVKEPTDINKLCDEFVRLSYHGLRAKNKDFNCDYKLDLDPNIPLINVVSQDIGRVILNMINNAFQACEERGRMEKVERRSDASYWPFVLVSTKLINENSVAPLHHYVSISISDNGPGIPDSIKDNIFQPFFTTKPTGQGTGLGLSLSYDIIKSHGGTIEVNSDSAHGTTFIIQLPVIHRF